MPWPVPPQELLFRCWAVLASSLLASGLADLNPVTDLQWSRKCALPLPAAEARQGELGR
jgi:hypothetical protein